jgi:pyruvate formate lyase activating enzyme
LKGLVSSLAIDPIEKKPLFHFLPGSRVFSVGFVGCNLRCPFCQNWQISQEFEEPQTQVSPEALVEQALASGCPSIAFTYSEPSIHIEYLIEASSLAQERGLQTVLVTNGNLNEGPAEELLGHINAVNLDIKCFSAATYARVLSGSLENTLAFARIAAAAAWLEVTTLVVPDLDDWTLAIDGICSFLASLSRDIPFHLSAYHPAWRYGEPRTRPELLSSLAGRAKRELAHVYVGNIAGEAQEDVCKACGAIHVRRRGYQVRVEDLVPDPEARGGREAREGNALCGRCGATAHYRLATEPAKSSFRNAMPEAKP